MLKIIFNIISLVNQRLCIPASLSFILEILSCIQILQLIFKTMASSLSNHKSILTLFTKSIPFFTAAFDFDSSSSLKAIIHPAWYLITFYLFAHIVLILVAVFVLKYMQTFKAATLKILAIAYTVHSRILFFPIHYFYLTLINLYKKEHPENSSAFYYQLAWFATTIIFLVANLLLVLIKEFFLYQTTKSKDYSAVKTNFYHQFIAAHKICLPMILVLARDMSSTARLSSILHLIFSLACIATLYRCLPFYKFKVLKVSVVMSTINLAMSVVGILQAFVKDPQIFSSLQILFFILPVLGVKISLGMFKRLLGRISVMRIHSPMHAIHFILLTKEACLENEVSEYQDQSFLPEKQLIIGFFSRNGINLLDMKDPAKRQDCKKEINSLILKNFEERYTQNPKNELLLSLIIRIYLKKFGNIAKGTHYLTKIENLGYSLHVKSEIDDFRSRLEEIYNKEYLKDDDSMKLSKYFKHKEMANAVKFDLMKEIEKHVNVWELLQENIIDIKTIVDFVEDIDGLFTEIQKRFFRNFDDLKANFPLPILMYAVYLHTIRCLPFEADQLFKKFQSVVFNKLTRNDFNTYSDTSAVVIISLDPKKAGLIIDATGSIQNVFGMKKNEIVGFNFACLFPRSIAKAYQQEVLQYAKAPTYKLDKKCTTYGKTGTGDTFELEAHFKLHSYHNKEITLAIILTQLSGPRSMFIANYSGNIVECSKDLKTTLQTEKLSFKAFRCMQDIASDFEVVNQAFNQTYDPNDLENQHSPNSEAKTARLLSLALETDAISARPLLNTNAEEVSLQRVSTMRKPSHNFALDRLSTNLRSRLLSSSIKKEDLNQEKAQEICDKFGQGRRVEILPAHNKNAKFKANVTIKPLVLNGEVHKVIFLTNLERERSSSLAYVEHNNSQGDSFADDFPGSNEFSSKLSPNFSLRKKTTRRSPETLQLFIPRSNIDFEAFSSDTFKSLSSPSAADQMKDRMLREIKAQEDHMRSDPDFRYIEGGALKALKSISSSTKMIPSLKYLILAVYFLLLFIMILAGFSTGMSRNSINEVSSAVNVVNIFTLRSFAIQQFWQYTTILYGGGLGLATLPENTINSIQNGMNTAKAYLVPSNSRLKNYLGRLDAQDLIRAAYKRDVTLYNYHGTFTQKSEVEIFTATDLLLAKYEPVITAKDLTALAQDPEIPFLLNNTGNDYLIKSQVLNDLTTNFLKETTSSKVSSLRFVLTTQIIALFLLTIVFILIPFIIANVYKRLLKALSKIEDVRLSERLTTIKTVQALFNEDMEDKSFILEAYKQFADPEAKPLTKNKRQSHEFTMTKMNTYLLKLELSAIVFIPIFLTLFGVGLNRSINTFQSFSRVSDELEVLKDCWDQSSTFLGSFAFSGIFLNKPNMLIKDRAPLQQLRLGLEAFESINAKLTDTFLKLENPDPFIESIFKDSLCQNLKVERYQKFCMPATQGGTIGMLVLNEEYLSASKKYVGTYLTYPSLLTLMFVALPYVNAISNLLMTLNVTYDLLIRHVREGFLAEVENSLHRELEYFFAIFALIIVYLAFIYLVPVKKLKRAGASRRKILKIIPLKMIQENKIFSWYLVNEFQDEVPNIRKYF